MKKARALSTICTSLGLALPLSAQVPDPGCYSRDYDAAHLARHPGQGVAALRLWVFEESPGRRAALVAARMADQGQGAADGVAGQELTSYAICAPEDGGCFVECDGGAFAAVPAGGGIDLTTRHFLLGEPPAEGCGGVSNLAEVNGSETLYHLDAVPAAVCADLAQVHPIPGEGCWGLDDPMAAQGVNALRLSIQSSDTARAFPQSAGVLGVTLPDGGRAAQGGMGGARVSVPVWCDARDGLCRSGPDDGGFSTRPEGEGLILQTAGFAFWGPDGAVFDLAVEGAPAVLVLTRLPDAACEGLE